MIKKIFVDSWGEVRGIWVLLAISLIAIVITAMLFGSIIYASNYLSYKQCVSYAEITQRKTDFKFMECYLLTERGWVPRSEFEKRAVTKE